MNRLIFVIALLIPMGAIPEENPPVAKDGLWSIHTEYTERPSGLHSVIMTSYCKNHAQEERTKTKQACRTVSVTSSDGKYVKETECTSSGNRNVIRMKFTATGDSAVRVETHVAFNPAAVGRTEATSISDQKYVGACPAGVQSGDILDASGKVIHHGTQ